MSIHPERRVPLVLAALLALGACAPERPATGVQRSETFHSEIVDDDYVLRIRTPPDADAESSAVHPLVIQLDPTYAGLHEYEITVGLVSQYAADGLWPEAVVVGVDYPEPATRERDYRPEVPPDPEFEGEGADRFHRVLRDEILPHLEATLPVDPARRILVGHSNGAVFGWYAALRHDPAEPPLFSGIVAADAGIDEVLFTLERWHAERSDALPLRLYASHAIYNGAIQQIAFDALIERIEARDYEGLDLMTQALETDHGGAVQPSFEYGLEHALGGEP